MSELAKLREERHSKFQQVASIHSTAEAENRDFSEDEQKAFDELTAEVERLDARLKVAERIAVCAEGKTDEEIEAEDAASFGGAQVPTICARSIDGIARVNEPFSQRYSGQRSPEGSLTKHLRALSEGTTAASTVDSILSATWLDNDLRAKSRVLQAGASVLNLTTPGSDYKFAKLLTDPVPGWRAASAAVAESDPTFAAVTIDPETLAVYFKVPVELLEDSSVLEPMIRAGLAGAFGAELDRVALEGAGSSNEPLGVYGMTNCNQYAMGANGDAFDSTIGYTPFLEAIRLLEVDGADIPDDLAYVCSPRSALQINDLRATDEQPLMLPPRIRGMRQLVTSGLSDAQTQGTASDAGSIYLGDWSTLVLGVRTALTIRKLDATDLMYSNLQVAFVAYLRMDVQCWYEHHMARIVGVIPA